MVLGLLYTNMMSQTPRFRVVPLAHDPKEREGLFDRPGLHPLSQRIGEPRREGVSEGLQERHEEKPNEEAVEGTHFDSRGMCDLYTYLSNGIPPPH